jgi:signal transduction histidine kinase
MLDPAQAPVGASSLPALQRHAAHRLHFTIQQSVKNSYSVWLISFFIALAAWRQVPAWLSLGWTVMVGAAYTARIRYLRGGRDRQAVEADHGAWERRFMVSTLACATVVAVGPALFFPVASEASRMYMTMLLCAWLAGAMASLGSIPRLFAAYSVFFVGGVALGWLLSETEYQLQIILMLGLYGIIVSSFSRNFARMVDDGVEIRFVNERLMADLNAAKDAAEEASAAKSRFLAVASHDLRQPLHAVTLLNGLLGRPQPPQSIVEISRHMARSLATLERLFSSVLDFSKLEAATVKPSLAWVALPALVEQVAAEYRPNAALKGLTLTHNCDDVEIHTDAHLMERILRNLLENAVKFTHRGAVSIAAGFAGDAFIVTVADTGPGVPANLRGEIFKEYFQVRDRKADEGLGLGLAIVQHLAGLLDMAVSVRDNLPQGALFELRIPGDRIRAIQLADIARQTASAHLDLAGLTILCIDDDAACLEALQALLKAWNARVLLARSPAAAHATATDTPEIDVILSDYELGDPQNGADLILALRERLGPVSGAILTGSAAAVQAHRAGRIEFPVLMKPVAAQELGELLEVFREMQ